MKINIPKIAVLLVHNVSCAGLFYLVQDWMRDELALHWSLMLLALAASFFVVWTPVLGSLFLAGFFFYVMKAPVIWSMLALVPMVFYIMMYVLYRERLVARSRADAQ